MEQVVHFRFLTGERVAQLIPTDWSFTPRLGGTGNGSFTFMPGAGVRSRPRAYWQDLRREWANVIAVITDGIVEYAGLVQSSSWDPNAGKLEVQTTEIGIIPKLRHAFTVGGWPSGDFGVYDLSLQGAAYAIIRQAFGKSGQWRAPVQLPPYVFPGTFRRTWPRQEFTTLGDMLQQVTTEENGPDIHYRPFLAGSGALNFEARIGTPLLAGQTFEVIEGRRQGNAAARFSRDGSQMRTGFFAVGSGSGVDVQWAEAGATPLWSDMPFLDESKSWKLLKDQTLQSHANEALARRRLPRETVEVTMPVLAPAGMPGPAEIPIGTRIRLVSPEDAVQDAATRDLYVLGLTRRMGQATYSIQTRDMEAVL